MRPANCSLGFKSRWRHGCLIQTSPEGHSKAQQMLNSVKYNIERGLAKKKKKKH
jgi:hypothetical protein